VSRLLTKKLLFTRSLFAVFITIISIFNLLFSLLGVWNASSQEEVGETCDTLRGGLSADEKVFV
jgi:hypothetical protein